MKIIYKEYVVLETTGKVVSECLVEKENVPYPQAVYDYEQVKNAWKSLWLQYDADDVKFQEDVTSLGRCCELRINTGDDTWFIRAICLKD